MAISKADIDIPDAKSLKITEESLIVELSDGRTIIVPLAWYPRLMHATQNERSYFRFIGKGQGIHWEELDEDISVEGLLAGRRSLETQSSLKRWLEERSKPTNIGDILWNELKKKDGQYFYTLTQNRPAKIQVYATKVTILYPSGNPKDIDRDIIEKAWNKLRTQGKFTVDDALEVTRRNGARTDRLLALLRMLDDVTFTASPRELQYKPKTEQ